MLHFKRYFEGTKMLETPATINAEAWAEWIDYRAHGKKKKVTDYGARKQWKLLSMYSFEQQQQIIDNSIMNDYQGLFALKTEKINGTHKANGKPRLESLNGQSNHDWRDPDSTRRSDNRPLLQPDSGDIWA